MVSHFAALMAAIPALLEIEPMTLQL